MPVEGSTSPVVNKRGLDLGAFTVQSKPFTRSVSISESNSDSIVPTSVTTFSPTLECLPSVKALSGGSTSISAVSYSPFSSGTATVSPESPMSYSNFFQPINRSNSNTSVIPDISEMAAYSGVDSFSVNSTTISKKDSLCHATDVESCSSIFDFRKKMDFSNYDYLLQNSSVRRTVNFLSHLIDSRLSPDWRVPLDYWQKHACLQHTMTISTIKESESEQTGILSSVIMPAANDFFQSENEQISVKRFKHCGNDSTLTAEKDFTEICREVRSFRSSPTGKSDEVPPTFISARLITYARNLADHFESCYRVKLGNLLDDVARLSSVETEKSSSDDICSHTESSDINSVPDKPVTVSSAEDFQMSGSFEKIHLDAARSRFHNVLEELFVERINWGRIIAMLAFLRALGETIESKHISKRTGVSHNLEQFSQSISCETEADISIQLISDRSDLLNPVNSSLSAHEKLNINPESPPYSKCCAPTSLNSVIRPCAADYVIWTAEFIHGPRDIWSWIFANGNWEGLMNFESQPNDSHSTAHNLMSIVSGTSGDEETMNSLRSALTSVATIAVGAVGLMAAYHFLSKRM